VGENRARRPAILIFSKAPIPGYCKTRMQPELNPEECAELQDALFRDMLNLGRSLKDQAAVAVAYSPPEKAGYFETLRTEEMLFPQEGKDLGERILNGLRKLFSGGYAPIVILGTDTPLDEATLRLAFDRLAEGHTVVGPTLDGGYYLFGLHEYEEWWFQGIDWGTEKVLSQTVEKGRERGLKLLALTTLRDLDDWDDLAAMEGQAHTLHLRKWLSRYNWSKYRLSEKEEGR
jgi:rSAM/selenodomain-associated transferase 1